MLKLASLSLVALLSLSPALAKKPLPVQPAQPPHKVCTSPEAVIDTVPDGVKFDQKLEGDALKKLMANTNHSDADVDLALVFDKEGGFTVFVTFKAGCLIGLGGFPTRSKARLLGIDNTI